MLSLKVLKLKTSGFRKINLMTVCRTDGKRKITEMENPKKATILVLVRRVRVRVRVEEARR